MPNKVINSSDGLTFNDVIVRDGKAILLLALFPLVIAGILDLTSAAGTAASVVLSNKQANKDEKHHRELKSIARGNSISNDVIYNNNHLQINGNSINPLLVSSIISNIPELIKTEPEAAIKIKQ